MNHFSLSSFPKTGETTPSYVQIATGKGIYHIPLEDILFIECHQKKSILHTKNAALPLCIPLYRLGKVLPAPHFLQTHRSFLVNLKNISYIDKHKDPWTISFFASGKNAFISRSFRRQILAAVSLPD